MLQGRLGSHGIPLIQYDNVAGIGEYQGELVRISPIPQYLQDRIRRLINYRGSLKVPQVKYPHLSVLTAGRERVDVACERDRVYLAVVRNQLLHNLLGVQVPYRANSIQLGRRYHCGLLLIPIEARHGRDVLSIDFLLYFPEQFSLAF